MVISIIALTVAVIALCIVVKKEKKYPVVVEYEEGAVALKKAHDGDACYDLCIKEDMIIHQGRFALPTGVKMKMPKRIHCFILPTSGNSLKCLNARIVNEDGTISDYRVKGDVRIGTIDNCYTNNLGIIIEIEEFIPATKTVFFEKGTKLGQVWFAKELNVSLIEGDTSRNTTRGNDGYGSTDKKTKS